MNRLMDNRVEYMIRQWIMLEEHQHELHTTPDEEDDIAEIVFLPTGYELRGLRRAS